MLISKQIKFKVSLLKDRYYFKGCYFRFYLIYDDLQLNEQEDDIKKRNKRETYTTY